MSPTKELNYDEFEGFSRIRIQQDTEEFALLIFRCCIRREFV
jgi:hypothetical protein